MKSAQALEARWTHSCGRRPRPLMNIENSAPSHVCSFTECLMERLLYCDALATLYLQNLFCGLPHTETVAASVTKLGDPRYAYVVAFPVVFWWLGPVAGYHVLLAASAAEWCNIVLKWLLLGNRPYWWVWLHTDWPHLLHQTPVTCETGPGNPSGHVMITLVVLKTCVVHMEKRGRGRRWRWLAWLTVAVIGLSRLLISAHFLHQIACGLLFGELIHSATSHRLLGLVQSHRACPTLALAPVMIGLALLIFQLWTWLGMDPGFSIPLARRFCANEQWVKLNTTPLFSLMRAAGTVVGVASMIALRPLPQTEHPLAGLLISVLLIGCLEMVPIATEITLFYIQSLCVCAVVPVTVGIVHFLIVR